MQVLIIGYVWPEPASSAAGKRMFQLLELLLQNNYKINFSTPAVSTPYMEDLGAMGIETSAIAVNDPGFDEFLSKLDPTIVIFDRFMMEEQFGWRVAKICPNAIRVLDTEDLHFLRKSREIQLTGNSNPGHSELSYREIASIYRCDLNLIISEIEMEILLTHYNVPKNLIFYLPFLFEEIRDDAKQDLPSFEARIDFIYIGNLRHAPNLDAIYFLKKEIWPLIQKELPQAKIHIYGAYSPAKIDQLHDARNGFYIRGRAEDAEEVVKNARVSLVPLRFGAGLKGKLTESMICGTPSVTTSTGAEGIHDKMPWGGEIHDDPQEFARAAIKLYNSEEKWTIARNNGFKIINTRFLKSTYSPKFVARLTEIIQNLHEHREQNFTGGMLMHHRIKSTYYLSKYIEAKSEKDKVHRNKK